MKKINRLIAMVAITIIIMLTLCIFASASDIPGESSDVATETESTEEFDLATYIQEKIAPTVIVVVSGAATLYIAISPILLKIRTATDKFKQATTDVNTTSGNGKESIREAREFRELTEKKISEMMEDNERRFSGLMNQITDKFGEYEKQISGCARTTDEVREILKIAFLNNAELVRTGYAAMIAKVGKAEVKHEANETEADTSASN